MKATFVVVPMLLLAGLAGCAGDTGKTGGTGSDGVVGEPAAPAPAALPVGRTFLSTAVTSAGQPKALVAGTTIRLAVGPNNVISVQAGCNTVSGQARIEGGKLVADELGITAIGCPANLSEQDNWVYGFFRAGPAWQLAGNELVLSAGDLKLTFTDRAVAEPARPLLDTQWKVDTIVDAGGSASSVSSEAVATLMFASGDKVSGRLGCNSFGGTATVAGNQITFGDLAMTRKACSGSAGAVEADLVKILDGALTYRIEGNRLILSAPDGSGVQLVG